MSKQVESVGAVLKVFSILQALSRSQTASLSELETQLMMPKSTIYRFLQTMQTLGYVTQNADNERYSLTLELFHLGAKALNNIDINKLAHPIMKHIMNETGETVHLGELDRDAVIYIHKVESHHSLRMASQIGKRAEIYSTAMGKILCAFGENKELAIASLKNKDFVKHTENTLVNYDAFLQQVEWTKQNGFAYDREENESSLFCIAVPVFDVLEHAIASMSLSFPTFRCDEAKFQKYHELLRDASVELSKLLGSKTIEKVFGEGQTF